MTLIPVSNISVVGVRFSTLGADRWIGQRSPTSTSPAWSIGSPSRLKMRPRVMSPTGTVIGPPVSITSVPRLRPSVVSMATARTRSSPRCCWTSQTRTVPVPEEMPSASSGLSSRSMTIAWLISGSSSGKTASITTPWISSIRPTFRVPPSAPGGRSMVAFMVRWCSCSALDQRLGAGDDFHDLLGDLGLAGAVHLQGEVLDDLAGVLRGAAHGGHARAELGGRGLQQRPVDRDLDVVRDQPLQDLVGVRLVVDQGVVLRARLALVVLARLEDGGLLQGQQGLAPHLLGERRDVAVVDDLDAVDLTVDVGGHEIRGDLA